MSEFVIEERKEGNAVILALSGNLDMGDSSMKLRNSVRESLDAGIPDIALDMSNVTYLDSSGIGELIASLVAANRENKNLVLLNPTDQIQRLFEISQLTELFDIEFR